MPISLVVNADLSVSGYSPYDLTLGRLGFPTLYDDIEEAVGDALDTIGAGVVPGQRSARPLNINVPLHGLSSSADPYNEGLRMRRQMRGFMENPAARLRGVYMTFRPDSELNGWLIIGGGGIKYEEGGVAFANFSLQMKDAYVVGNLRTHRPARRIEIYDRRLTTTPRDVMNSIYLGAYSTKASQPLAFLQQGASQPMYLRTAVTTGARQALDGVVPVVANPTDRSTIFYDLNEVDINRGGVVILDRKGVTNNIKISRNEAWNAGGEQSASGWYQTPTSTTPTQVTANRPGSTGTKAIQAAPTGVAAAGTVTLGNGLGDSHHVTAGQVVTFDGWARLTVAGTNLKAVYQFYDASNAALGAAGQFGSTVAAPTTNTWYELAGNVTVPANAVRIQIFAQYTQTGAGTGGIQGDDWLIATGTAAYTGGYFDGTYPASRYTTATTMGQSETGFNLAGDLNPQNIYGWEEVYGRNHPLSPGDVPVIQNGLCRVRYDATNVSFIVERAVVGLGYAEVGRVYFTVGRNGAQYNVLTNCVVDEWTFERGRIKCTLGGPARLEVFITLEHGHIAPRFEAYGTYPYSSLGMHVVQRQSADTDYSSGTYVGTAFSNPANNTSMDAFVEDATHFSEPWAQMVDHYGTDPLVLAVVTWPTAYARRDTLAYGGVMHWGICLEDQGLGYVSAWVAQVAPGAGGAPDYMGKDDLWKSILADTRSIPDLVAR